MGWGVHLEGDMLQGKWEPWEQQIHINLLEMRPVFKALLGFSLLWGATVLVSSDNSTVVSYINRKGRICSLPMERDGAPVPAHLQLLISLRVVHMPWKMNIMANLQSH